MPSISSRVSIRTGWNSRRPSRVRLRIAVIRRSILAIDDLMKPSASVKSCESCLSAPSSTGSAVSVALSGAGGAEIAARASVRDPLEDVAAQFLELAGEAHDVDQRRAQIVADDIGEALDLVVGLAQIGGALVDGGFQIEVVVAQLRFGLVARAARSAAPGKSKCRPARSRGRSRRRSRRRPASGCGRHWSVRRTNSRSSSARIWPARSRMRSWRRGRRHLAHDRGGVVRALRSA